MNRSICRIHHDCQSGRHRGPSHHRSHLRLRVACLLLSLLLIIPFASCSQKDSQTSTPKPTTQMPTSSQKAAGLSDQQIRAITSAGTSEQREQAVLKLVQAGRSLGVVDEKGQQLNTNTPSAPVSMGPVDLEAYAMLSADGAGRQLGSIIDFLAASGVILHATQKKVDAESLLPDIQKYVDWSFQNRDDLKSVLGLLIAAGPTLQIPGSSPKLSRDTWVSPLAGILLMADLLIGLPKETPAKTATNTKTNANTNTDTGTGRRTILDRLWLAQPVMASGLKETAETLQGLITIISPVLPDDRKIPDVVNSILAAFAMGDRIVLRTVDPASKLDQSPIPDIRKIELKPALNHSVRLVPVAMLIPSRTILLGVQMTFTIDLVSPGRALGSAAGPLYPDADAQLASFQGRDPLVQLDGHRLRVSGRPPMEAAGFSITRTLAQNEQAQAALLYATATVELPQLTEVLTKYDSELSRLGTWSQAAASAALPRDKVEKYYREINSGLKVAALAYPVILLPKNQETALSFETEGTLVSGLPTRFKPVPGELEKTWPLQFEWLWEWGDGTSQSVPSRTDLPIYTYEKPGAYNVRLSARQTASKEVMASVEQEVVIQDLPAITEKTSTGISYHLFEEKDAQIPFLLNAQMSMSELWRLNLCSFEAPEPSWVSFPTLRFTYKGQVLNYSPPNQPPSYLGRTIRLQIRYVNELNKANVSYAHKQDTGTLIGNEWIVSTESNKKSYASIMQQAETNKQSRIVESSMDENRMRFIYMNSPKSSLQMNNGYIATHVERRGSCIIDINMNYPSPDDASVKQVLDAMVEYAYSLATKAEGHAARYIAAFTKR